MSEASGLEEFRRCDCRDLPIGVYLVKPDGQFIECNRVVREMLGLPLEGPVTHASLADFYVEPEKRKELLKKAAALYEQGKFLEREHVRFRVGEKELVVELYCREVRNRITGQVEGYLGCMVDITREVHRVDELTFDIGRILHANNTTLMMLTAMLRDVIATLGPNPLGGFTSPNTEEADEIIFEAANSLASVLERFVQIADPERRLKALPEAKWQFLAEQVSAFREFRKRIGMPEARPSALRVAAHEIVQLCQAIVPGVLPREAVRDLQQAAWQVERLATLIAALRSYSAVLQMEYTLNSLREYIIADSKGEKERKTIRIRTLLDQCIKRLVDFAQSRNVEILPQDIADVSVRVSEADVVRALANLLHNAIKYSWYREKGRKPWVSVRAIVREGRVHIEFENWGVPITKEEIEKGLIFQLGYRGRLSKDRGRLGTGIGLTDALYTAREHGGDLRIESRPSRYMPENDPDYYKVPFITTVTLILPVV